MTDIAIERGRIQTPAGSAPIIPILLIGAGAYLLWFGVRYFRSTGPAVWPSYPVKSILQGKGLPAPQPAAPAAANVAAYEATLPQPGAGDAGGGPIVPTGQPQNTARLLLARFGWQPDQMPALISLWNGESRWDSSAFNPSGAYGIAQALNHGKPGDCATGPRRLAGGQTIPPGENCAYSAEFGLSQTDAQAANSGHMLPQIRWGLGYIKARYGSPKAAYAAWLSRNPHWY